MIHTPMDVLHQFPVRKTKKQKMAFRSAVSEYITSLGYPVTVEKGGKAQNVVIGNPDAAQYLLTAHYDTCARMFLPNFVSPFNLFAYIFYQLLLVGILLGAAVGAGFCIYRLTNNESAGYFTGLAVYWIILLLMLYGPANPNNANDNTSGVVTLLEIMHTLPEEHRSKVCFVLFDLEESGMVGSQAYRKAHKAASSRQVVINLDCVGDGDEIVMIPCGKLKKDHEKLLPIAKICGYWGKKSLLLHKKGFSFYPSDQAGFPYGLAIGAFRRHRLIGRYYAKIHTKRDTQLDQTNVNLLRAALVTLLCQ